MPRFGQSALTLDQNRGKGWRAGALSPRRLVLALALALVAVVAQAHPSAAQAHAFYSCGDAQSGHCYGYADTPIPGAQGATTKIYMVQLQCNQRGGVNTTSGFIDNEMWLMASTYNWVEAGYWTVSNVFGTWQDYFWADYRPGDCSGCINVHDLGNVPGGDYGQNIQFIVRRSGQYSFLVNIISPNFSPQGPQLSSNNTMDVGHVEMGQELAGNAGASAPNARFSYRYYWDGSGNYTGIFGNYSAFQYDPPYVGYVAGDTDFYTHCC